MNTCDLDQALSLRSDINLSDSFIYLFTSTSSRCRLFSLSFSRRIFQWSFNLSIAIRVARPHTANGMNG